VPSTHNRENEMAGKPKAVKIDTKNLNFIVASKVREAFKANGFRVSGEFIDEFNTFIGEQLTKVGARARGNGRQTIRSTDI